LRGLGDKRSFWRDGLHQERRAVGLSDDELVDTVVGAINAAEAVVFVTYFWGTSQSTGESAEGEEDDRLHFCGL